MSAYAYALVKTSLSRERPENSANIWYFVYVMCLNNFACAFVWLEFRFHLIVCGYVCACVKTRPALLYVKRKQYTARLTLSVIPGERRETLTRQEPTTQDRNSGQLLVSRNVLHFSINLAAYCFVFTYFFGEWDILKNLLWQRLSHAVLCTFWFLIPLTAAILVALGRAPAWRLHTKLYKLVETLFRITRK